MSSDNVLHQVNIDASVLEKPVDFFKILYKALGAPSWQGFSVAAATDSIVWHPDILDVKPPYMINVRNVSKASPGVGEVVRLLSEDIAHSQEYRVANVGSKLEVTIVLED